MASNPDQVEQSKSRKRKRNTEIQSSEQEIIATASEVNDKDIEKFREVIIALQARLVAFEKQHAALVEIYKLSISDRNKFISHYKTVNHIDQEDDDDQQHESADARNTHVKYLAKKEAKLKTRIEDYNKLLNMHFTCVRKRVKIESMSVGPSRIEVAARALAEVSDMAQLSDGLANLLEAYNEKENVTEAELKSKAQPGAAVLKMEQQSESDEVS
ncbi:unnamed protein product [Zymoseptoria tritici ST99CH_3D1]|nr:unnamed protein product [Zymoseptoria tritici ST99CH_3D1]